jgi:hypothetical protein
MISDKDCQSVDSCYELLVLFRWKDHILPHHSENGFQSTMHATGIRQSQSSHQNQHGTGNGTGNAF